MYLFRSMKYIPELRNYFVYYYQSYAEGTKIPYAFGTCARHYKQLNDLSAF